MSAHKHPTWLRDEITQGCKDFNLSQYFARKRYLMNLDEREAQTLNTQDKYDRVRFLTQQLAARQQNTHSWLEEASSTGARIKNKGPRSQQKEKEVRREGVTPRTPYRD